MPFMPSDLTFSEDKAGVELENARSLEIELDYEELGLDPELAPEQLGEVLTRLLGTTMRDEEGIFDLVVRKDGEIVATLTLACEDDALEVVGEHLPAVTEAELADALLSALPRR